MSARWTQADVAKVLAQRKVYSDAQRERRDRERANKLSKYGNVKTGSYASKREAKRGEELKLLEAAGKITNLREQVTFELIPKQKGERACKYIADFVYREIPEDGLEMKRDTVEDVKGYANAVYRIKKKLMLHVHGIRVRES